MVVRIDRIEYTVRDFDVERDGRMLHASDECGRRLLVGMLKTRPGG